MPPIARSKADERGTDRRTRADVAYRLETLNLLGHVVSRTRKREVTEWVVQRDAIAEPVQMTEAEATFYSGLTEIVLLLLKKGARPDLRNNLGYNALMMGSQEGQVEVVKALLNAGADRNLRNKKRETAIDIATASGHSEISQLLK